MRVTTATIANRAVSVEFIGLGVFANTVKSFDLTFKKIKINTKCKRLGYGLGAKAVACPLPYLP